MTEQEASWYQLLIVGVMLGIVQYVTAVRRKSTYGDKVIGLVETMTFFGVAYLVGSGLCGLWPLGVAIAGHTWEEIKVVPMPENAFYCIGGLVAHIGIRRIVVMALHLNEKHNAAEA